MLGEAALLRLSTEKKIFLPRSEVLGGHRKHKGSKFRGDYYSVEVNCCLRSHFKITIRKSRK